MTLTATATATEILKSQAAAQDTETLIGALELLDREDASNEERMVRATVLGVIEDRHPEILPAVDAWADSLTDTRTYARVVLDEMGR